MFYLLLHQNLQMQKRCFVVCSENYHDFFTTRIPLYKWLELYNNIKKEELLQLLLLY